MTDLERDLIAVTRRFNVKAHALAQVVTERDELIRRAHAAGMARSRIVEITALSPARIDQIRHEHAPPSAGSLSKHVGNVRQRSRA